MSKAMYEAKERYAKKKMQENTKIDTLTDEQHDALAQLCAFRHKFHSNKDSLFLSESAFSGEFSFEMQSDENSKLREVGLPTIEWSFYDNSHIPDDSFREWFNFANYSELSETIQEQGLELDLDDDETYELVYDELYTEAMGEYEELNQDIEKYLRRIDEEHGTQYCPTGFARLR
uniref:AcrVA1 n=4 Tax=Moraxella bovoculi TaxID=386891 RepID=A0ACD6BAU5_9GAMM|nr:Chain B, AcrVA1 [Moraxella bovoculi]